MARQQTKKTERKITLYESILGTAIVDTDTLKGGMYLFNPPKTKYMKPSKSTLADDYECFKGMNDINKPFAILLYEQVYKKKPHGIQGREITQAELETIIGRMTEMK